MKNFEVIGLMLVVLLACSGSSGSSDESDSRGSSASSGSIDSSGSSSGSGSGSSEDSVSGEFGGSGDGATIGDKHESSDVGKVDFVGNEGSGDFNHLMYNKGLSNGGGSSGYYKRLGGPGGWGGSGGLGGSGGQGGRPINPRPIIVPVLQIHPELRIQPAQSGCNTCN